MITVDVNPSDLITRLKEIIANQTETLCILEAEIERLRDINAMLAPTLQSVPADDPPPHVLSDE